MEVTISEDIFAICCFFIDDRKRHGSARLFQY